MKLLNARQVLVISALVGGITYFGACTHDDTDIGTFIPPGPSFSQTELVSKKVTTAPTIDGIIESAWDSAQPLITRAIVPDPGDNFMVGYVGNNYNVAMRSLYDKENIYMLIEWDDNTANFNRQPWYFNPDTKRWAQEVGEHIVNASGGITRNAFGEDKFGVLWNINSSVADWSTKTCYASCHTGLGAANGYARHYTNSATEKIDMWHWKSVRDNPGTTDDQYQDNTQPNGRKSDAATSGGASDNKQTLTITGTSTSVTVPKYVMPGSENYYWISQSDVDGGTAKLITAVDANGILTYAGGSIDPNTDKAFQRDGSTTGSKVIPSVVTSLLQGSRGDIAAKGVYTKGKGWTVELRRKLNTGDAANDINFADLSDQFFGIGVFDNTGHSHAIKPGLLLKFKK